MGELYLKTKTITVLLSMKYLLIFIFALAPSLLLSQAIIHVPRLAEEPVIDADLSEWKDLAFHDGVWDIYRLQHTPWFDDHRRNRLTLQSEDGDVHPGDDLSARYYIAWDAEYIYMGAEVQDNFNDTEHPDEAPKTWYFKDSICWFLEAPGDDAPEEFERGDNAFCFEADESKKKAAWWRHGSDTEEYLEDPLPDYDYDVKVSPSGNFVMEARVKMASTFPISDSSWTPPKVGDEYRMEIVHCDPDGGPYGGHFMIYGTGDDDSSWARMILIDEQPGIERLEK